MTLLKWSVQCSRKKAVILFCWLMAAISIPKTFQAQCLYSPVIATTYFEGDCGDKKTQNLVGVTVPVYGQSGSLYFTSPLTDHVFSTATKDESLITALVYPNPAFDFIHIEWPNNESAEVLIYSQLGQLISKSFIEGNSLSTVDIHRLLAGYYILKTITPSNKTFITKFIKQ
jgi:hypothetical protein